MRAKGERIKNTGGVYEQKNIEGGGPEILHEEGQKKKYVGEWKSLPPPKKKRGSLVAVFF